MPPETFTSAIAAQDTSPAESEIPVTGILQAAASPILSISRRTRNTPFTRRVTEAGVKGYTVYNRMLLPTFFESIEEDYHHLKTHVQLWDVSVQRQIELRGPDARALVQYITPRDLGKMADDQCYYIPVVDDTGGMLNDPVAVKHSTDRWWISIADSDLLLWLKGLAIGRGMNVDIFEPDISPLAVQGPKANELMSRVFGEEIKQLGFFRHRKFEFNGDQITIARSGFSKQGGLEIYVEGAHHAEPMWDSLIEAGHDLNVRAGCPNLIERIEAGLLSYGNDITRLNTLHEAGLARFCKTKREIDCIGKEAIARDNKNGPDRQIRGVMFGGARAPSCTTPWFMTADDIHAGQITSCAYSPHLEANVAIAMVEKTHWEPETAVIIHAPDGPREGVVKALPFT